VGEVSPSELSDLLAIQGGAFICRSFPLWSRTTFSRAFLKGAGPLLNLLMTSFETVEKPKNPDFAPYKSLILLCANLTKIPH